jgi:hypothetical protein
LLIITNFYDRFPGYAWTIAYCARCFNHMGYVYFNFNLFLVTSFFSSNNILNWPIQVAIHGGERRHKSGNILRPFACVNHPRARQPTTRPPLLKRVCLCEAAGLYIHRTTGNEDGSVSVGQVSCKWQICLKSLLRLAELDCFTLHLEINTRLFFLSMMATREKGQIPVSNEK